MTAAVIKTRHRRMYHSDLLNRSFPIEHVYVDQPATVETWIDNCSKLAAEFGLSPLDVHDRLFTTFPEVFQ